MSKTSKPDQTKSIITNKKFHDLLNKVSQPIQKSEEEKSQAGTHCLTEDT